MGRDLTLIGFGEAGRTFAASAQWRACAYAYDRKTDEDQTRAEQLASYHAVGVVPVESVEAAVTASPVILSLVTADQAYSVAEAVARHDLRGVSFFDGNSVAPGTKRRSARLIEAAGGNYIDMAILAPVEPARLDVPILISGKSALAAEAQLRSLGFRSIRALGKEVGRASSVKMIRSIVIKGIEALTAECVLAAARANVLDEVLSSLDASEKPLPWRERADYNLDRMLVHGLRRAAEMEEVSSTLRELGVDPEMTKGTIARQRAFGTLGIARPGAGIHAKLDIIENRGARAA